MGKERSRSRSWSVFDAIKTFPASPETLMVEIDVAIAAVEYDHATSLLSSSFSHLPSPAAGTKKAFAGSSHDARLAEEAYRAACAALAAGRPESAVRSIRIALASCPPDKSSAMTKLRSLFSVASSQLEKKKQPQQ